MHKFTVKSICNGFAWRFLHGKHIIISFFLSIWALLQTQWRFLHSIKVKTHSLPGELVVSLTSYPPRFATLPLTLKCLLIQTIRADRIILWIAGDAIAELPTAVTALIGKGLEIRSCNDTGPYKKIIPALQEFPNAFIVTADDDLYYYPNWLHDLIQSWDNNEAHIVCHRAHSIKFDDAGVPAPYRDWDFDIKGPVQSKDIFPTGVGGILYPPGVLSKDVFNEAAFQSLTPRADDIWLYFMGRRAGAVYLKTPGRIPHILWLKSQKTALVNENLIANSNNKKITAMIEHYGWPR